MGSNKLLPKFIGPFRVLRRIGNAYTIELPRKMRTHPTFHVGRLRPYHQYETSSGEEIPCAQASPRDTCGRGADYKSESEARISPREAERYPDELPPARREENAVSARSQAEQKQNLIDFSPVPRRNVTRSKRLLLSCSRSSRSLHVTCLSWLTVSY